MGDGPHIDNEALETLREVMEDEFQLLIDTFLHDSSERLVCLRDAISRQDSEAVRTAAHSFKGSSSNIGAPQLAELCFQIEEAGRKGELGGTEQLLSDIQLEYKVVSEALANL